MDWMAVAVLVAWAYGGFAVVECLVEGWSRLGEKGSERRARLGDS
jgi:hypothetical protein